MALEIKLSQKLSQSLVMTPQLQQAIKLLQLGRYDYLDAIEKELLENPLLETVNDLPDTSENNSEPEPAAGGDDFRLAEPDGNYLDTYPGGDKGSSHGGDDDWGGVEGFSDGEKGLFEHLSEQLGEFEFSAAQGDVANYIIGNLDRNGYLSCAICEIAERCQVEEDEVRFVLKQVQELDPPGIAALNLQDCLLIQLRHQGLANTIAARIVEEYLELLAGQKFDKIARALSVTVEEVYGAVTLIRSLEPRPGREFSNDLPQYIVPDVYVKKVGDEYVISLNDDGIPRLRLRQGYERLLEAGSSDGSAGKSFFQEKLKSANWIMRSIEQRRATIYKVARSIMRVQRDFLENGVSGLKPLVLRDIAEEINMHESTVSRVTTNKYIHTPHGVYELKYFFSSGLRGGEGDVSSESVKERIRQLIEAEEKKKPLSDQALEAILCKEGIEIARRTVAKYREAMGIASSSQRKKVF
ncbi:MAG: RNA polymerase factor sigma-54 [bacterium]|nr:RNA polymerase factor sigma-54 [bacterium]